MKKTLTLLAAALSALLVTAPAAEAGSKHRHGSSHQKKSHSYSSRSHSHGWRVAPRHSCPPSSYGSSSYYYRDSSWGYARPYGPDRRCDRRPSYSFSLRLGGW